MSGWCDAGWLHNTRSHKGQSCPAGRNACRFRKMGCAFLCTSQRKSEEAPLLPDLFFWCSQVEGTSTVCPKVEQTLKSIRRQNVPWKEEAFWLSSTFYRVCRGDAESRLDAGRQLPASTRVCVDVPCQRPLEPHSSCAGFDLSLGHVAFDLQRASLFALCCGLFVLSMCAISTSSIPSASCGKVIRVPPS